MWRAIDEPGRTETRPDGDIHHVRAIPEQGRPMRIAQCSFCDSDRYEERRIEYLYSHKGKYLLVPNTPVEICLNCGMVYYDAAVLKEIERRFFAIQHKHEKPDRYIEMPAMAYA